MAAVAPTTQMDSTTTPATTASSPGDKGKQPQAAASSSTPPTTTTTNTAANGKATSTDNSNGGGGGLLGSLLARATAREGQAPTGWFGFEGAAKKPGSLRALAHTAAAVVAANSTLYVFGGIDCKKNSRTNDLFAFSFETQTWSKVKTTGAKPRARSHHAMAAYDTKLLIFGGSNIRGCLSDLYEFDTATNTWKEVSAIGDNPSPRWGHGMVRSGTNLYLFGGYFDDEKSDEFKNLDDLYEYDIAARIWRRIKVSGGPSGREGHGMVARDGTLWVFGGRDATALNDTYSFNIEQRKWKVVQTRGSLPRPRVAHAMSVTESGHLLVFGGEDSEGVCLDDMYEMSLESGTWRRLRIGESPATPRARMGCVSAVAEEHFFVFGGFDDSGHGLRELVCLNATQALASRSSASGRKRSATEMESEAEAEAESETVEDVSGSKGRRRSSKDSSKKEKKRRDARQSSGESGRAKKKARRNEAGSPSAKTSSGAAAGGKRGSPSSRARSQSQSQSQSQSRGQTAAGGRSGSTAATGAGATGAGGPGTVARRVTYTKQPTLAEAVFYDQSNREYAAVSQTEYLFKYEKGKSVSSRVSEPSPGDELILECDKYAKLTGIVESVGTDSVLRLVDVFVLRYAGFAAV